jgi:hypothetical protein
MHSPWWRFGAGWLGRDERTGAALRQPRRPEWSEEAFHALTRDPRRYGFHATLKAPFRLRDGLAEKQLFTRVDALAAELASVRIGALVPVIIDNFVALAPAERQPGLEALAARCVTELEDLRAPLSQQELARRRPERLTLTEREMLLRFGYPYVLGLFRFHMTLSGPADPVTGDLLVQRAHEAVLPLNAEGTPVLDRLCVFREDHPGAPFLRVHERELAS